VLAEGGKGSLGTVIVENRAGGNISGGRGQSPDGLTLGVAATASHINPGC
jgi:hypothetical protein